LVACTNTDQTGQNNASLSQIAGGGPSTMIGDVVNGLLPPPSREFTYVNSPSTDAAIFSSLRANPEDVVVTVNSAFTTGAVPDRMAGWLNAVRRSGGSIANCQREEQNLGLSALRLAWGGIQQYVEYQMYQQAQQYNAFVHTDRSGQVHSVVFRKRNSETTCGDGYQRADSWEATPT
jgi:hypothetical protein